MTLWQVSGAVLVWWLTLIAAFRVGSSMGRFEGRWLGFEAGVQSERRVSTLRRMSGERDEN